MPELLPYMPFFGTDFYGSESVAAMGSEAESVYLRMLWVQWTKGSVPDDPTMVAKLTMGEPKLVKKGWKIARKMFETDQNGRLLNKKLEEIRAQIEAKSGRKTEANRNNGKLGGRPKKDAPGSNQEPTGFLFQNPTETQQKPTGLSVGFEKETQKKATRGENQNQNHIPPPSSSVVSSTTADELWSVFEVVQAFANGNAPSQRSGLAELAREHEWLPPDRLIAEAKRCRDHYAVKRGFGEPNTTRTESAPAKFRDWLRREAETLRRELATSPEYGPEPDPYADWPAAKARPA